MGTGCSLVCLGLAWSGAACTHPVRRRFARYDSVLLSLTAIASFAHAVGLRCASDRHPRPINAVAAAIGALGVVELGACSTDILVLTTPCCAVGTFAISVRGARHGFEQPRETPL